MRNLKKITSLALVCVLALGLMLTASARDYSDSTDIKNTEAVALLGELQIMQGHENGSFEPNGTLTRGQLAKMVYVALNRGIDDKATMFASVSVPFVDTKAIWSEGYINFCYINGIVSGVTPTRFNPEGKVTGFETMKMLLTSLGYDADKEGFKGELWQSNVLRVASRAGLLEGFNGVDASKAISRDNAALLTYNMLSCYMVTYKDGVATETTKTYALDKLGLYTLTGVLVSNDKASLTGTPNSKSATSTIVVDGKDIIIPASSDINMLGMNVTAYVKAKDLAKADDGKWDDNVSKVYGAIIEAVGKNTVYNGTASDLTLSNGGKTLTFKVSSKKNISMTVTGTLNVTKNFDQIELTQAALDALNNSVNVRAIDNDSDGKLDQVVIIERAYGTVTYNSEASQKITFGGITRQDDDYTAIAGVSSLQKDDRVLFYQIKNGAYVIEKAPTFVGTLTGTTSDSDGKIYATISGSSYVNSEISNSKVKQMSDLIASSNLNKELTFYTDGRNIVEFKAPDTTTTDKYLVIMEAAKLGTGAAFDPISYKANVLMSNGTKGEYKVHSINNATDSDNAFKDKFTNAATDLVGKVFAYTINKDNKLVLTDNSKTVSTTITPANNVTFDAADNGAIKTAAGTKILDSQSIAFIKKIGGDVDEWTVSIGRNNIKKITSSDNNPVDVSMYLGDYSSDGAKDKIIAMALTGDTRSESKYGVLVSNVQLSDDNTGVIGKFRMFNGTEEKDMTTDYDVVKNTTNGNAKLGDTANIKAGSIVKYELSGDKISSIEPVNPKIGEFKAGYATTLSNNLVALSMFNNAAAPTLDYYTLADDVKVYAIGDKGESCSISDTANVAIDTSDVPADFTSGAASSYRTVLHFNDKNKVDAIYTFLNDMK